MNTFFKEGKNDIVWIGNSFKEHFGDVDFTIPQKLDLKIRKLESYMNDKEILAEFKPMESNLGEIAYALKNDILSKDGYANIFYVRDKDNVLWAVYARWYSGTRDWRVDDGSVEDWRDWCDGSQVVSRSFSESSGQYEFVTRKEFDDFEEAAEFKGDKWEYCSICKTVTKNGELQMKFIEPYRSPKGKETWEERFDKEFTNFYSGDSGLGGNDPQEPVYEMNTVDPKEIKSFIKDLLAEEKSALVKELLEKVEKLKEYDLGCDGVGGESMIYIKYIEITGLLKDLI